MNSTDQKILELLVNAQKRMDTNQLRGDEEQIMKAKQGKIFGISWKRYREEAMKPEKGQESIIVSFSSVK